MFVVRLMGRMRDPRMHRCVTAAVQLKTSMKFDVSEQDFPDFLARLLQDVLLYVLFSHWLQFPALHDMKPWLHAEIINIFDVVALSAFCSSRASIMSITSKQVT